MRHRLKAPSPALVISLIALFVALGGGAALASGLISGNQIVNHSIPTKKLTAAAVKALHGPGEISIRREVGPGSGSLLHNPVHGVDVFYRCDPTTPLIGLGLRGTTDLLSYSGEYAADGAITSLTRLAGAQVIPATATKTLNLDLVAFSGAGTQVSSRFDLAGVFVHGPKGGGGCDIWGLITPGP